MIESQDGARSFMEESSMEEIFIVFGFAALMPFAGQVLDFLVASRRRRLAHSRPAAFSMDAPPGDSTASVETTTWYDRAA